MHAGGCNDTGASPPGDGMAPLTGDYRLYYMCSTALWPQTVKKEPRFSLHAEHAVDIDITLVRNLCSSFV